MGKSVVPAYLFTFYFLTFSLFDFYSSLTSAEITRTLKSPCWKLLLVKRTLGLTD